MKKIVKVYTTPHILRRKGEKRKIRTERAKKKGRKRGKERRAERKERREIGES